MAMSRRAPVLAAAFACILFLIALVSKGGSGNVNFEDWKPTNLIPTYGARRFLEDRLRHSEMLWSKSVANRQLMANAYRDPDKSYKFPQDYFHPYNPFDFIMPTFNCPHDSERVGSLGDGGKWVCGMSKYESYAGEKPYVIYSFGVEWNSEFEEQMLNRTNCEIWGYDYTVTAWGNQLQPSSASRAHFQQIGIGKVTDKLRDPPFYNIQDLMQENGHDYIDLLKMDIEGAEFDAFDSLVEAFGKPGQALPIGQILIEMHLRPDEGEFFHMPQSLNAWLQWWESLEAGGLRPVWIEPNLFGNMMGAGQPRYSEYTLINVMNRDKNIIMRE